MNQCKVCGVDEQVHWHLKSGEVTDFLCSKCAYKLPAHEVFWAKGVSEWELCKQTATEEQCNNCENRFRCYTEK
jgi:hypothetical protein